MIVTAIILCVKDSQRKPNITRPVQQPLPPSQRALERLRKASEDLREANEVLKHIEEELAQLDMRAQNMGTADYEEEKRQLEFRLRSAKYSCDAYEQEHKEALEEYRNN